jgi:hypothetical protein
MRGGVLGVDSERGGQQVGDGLLTLPLGLIELSREKTILGRLRHLGCERKNLAKGYIRKDPLQG